MPTDKERLAIIFSYLSEPAISYKFFEHVSDNVHWTVKGHSPLSGTYTSKQSFMEATISVFSNEALTGPMTFDIVNVVADSELDEEDAKRTGQGAVELKAKDGTMCKSGLEYNMTYCWVVKFEADDEELEIVEIRTYLDTGLLERAVAAEKERLEGEKDESR